jgi:hypothetical protein
MHMIWSYLDEISTKGKSLEIQSRSGWGLTADRHEGNFWGGGCWFWNGIAEIVTKL